MLPEGLALPPAAPAVAWLPASLDRAPSPVPLVTLPTGPLGGASADEAALLRGLLVHLLSDGGPLPAALVPGVFLELPSIDDLPPGMDVLGGTGWALREIDPWTDKFSLARWGTSP